MPDETSLLDRIDALERRVAQQDQVIEELSKTVTGLWKRIDGLVRQITHLGTRLKDRSDDTESAPHQPGQ